MYDKEFIRIKDTIIKCIIFIIIFVVPISIAFAYKFKGYDTGIVSKVKNSDTYLLFVTNKTDNKSKDIKEILKENKVKYIEINIDKITTEEYNTILKKSGINKNDIVVPTLIYVEEKELKTSLVDISDENEIRGFLEYSNLID